jgi:D-alanine transaminase
LFGVLAGELRTAPKNPGILPGTTRDLVLRLAQEAAVPAREQALQRDDLPRVSELFLTGTTSEVMPVVRMDGRPVADGRPGPVTQRLQEAYARAVAAFLGT